MIRLTSAVLAGLLWCSVRGGTSSADRRSVPAAMIEELVLASRINDGVLGLWPRQHPPSGRSRPYR
jgi:hypothetical protein